MWAFIFTDGWNVCLDALLLLLLLLYELCCSLLVIYFSPSSSSLPERARAEHDCPMSFPRAEHEGDVDRKKDGERGREGEGETRKECLLSTRFSLVFIHSRPPLLSIQPARNSRNHAARVSWLAYLLGHLRGSARVQRYFSRVS